MAINPIHRTAEDASSVLWPPPIGSARFWVVQALVIGVTIIQELLWLPDIKRLDLGIPPFIAVGLFGVPILYAALNYGFTASMATATTATGITVVTIAVNGILGMLPTLYAWAYAVELGSLLVVAASVGSRFEREMLARIEIEKAAAAATAAEVRYHSLFEASAAPVLLVDSDGIIREANESARKIFSPNTLFGKTLTEVTNHRISVALLSRNRQRSTPTHLVTPDGTQYMLVATAVPHDMMPGISGGSGNEQQHEMMQVIFQDVTEEVEHQRRTEAYAEHVLRAQEEERRRIARELHDEPVQSLVHLCHRIDAVMDSADLPENTLVELESTRTLTEDTITELRNIATALRPPALDDLGLVASLRNLIAEYRERDTAKIWLKTAGMIPKLDKWQELTIYRIAQEALSNVERHSGATQVTVSLKSTPSMLRLVVVDNGHGFAGMPFDHYIITDQTIKNYSTGIYDKQNHGSGSAAGGEASYNDRAHLGLLGMTERAQLVGASLRIVSHPDQGTLVSLKMRY